MIRRVAIKTAVAIAAFATVASGGLTAGAQAKATSSDDQPRYTQLNVYNNTSLPVTIYAISTQNAFGRLLRSTTTIAPHSSFTFVSQRPGALPDGIGVEYRITGHGEGSAELDQGADFTGRWSDLAASGDLLFAALRPHVGPSNVIFPDHNVIAVTAQLQIGMK